MELVATLGRTLGFSFAAGINLYAAVLLLGVASRFDWVELPDHFQVFNHDLIIGLAAALYLVEFVADKIPWVDSLWDAVHTLVRPVGGALIAVAALGDASPTLEGLVALLGGTLAAGTHVTKAGARAAVNTSPEPLSNWVLSLGEDAFVVALGGLALAYPVAALTVVAGLSLVLVLGAGAVVRLGWRRVAGRARDGDAGEGLKSSRPTG